MGKEKKEHKESSEDNYDKRVNEVLPFAHPLASKKLNKKVLKTIKKGM